MAIYGQQSAPYVHASYPDPPKPIQKAHPEPIVSSLSCLRITLQALPSRDPLKVQLRTKYSAIPVGWMSGNEG